MAMITMEQMKSLLVQSPIVVSVQASNRIFYLYTGGVITDDECGTDVDHEVLVVGYGQADGLDYFLIKNSWATDWGESGYLRIGTKSSNNLGVCGILTRPVYLMVVT